ncbi:MAG TPA: prolyl oligopeptidase family serine peptidase [Blastocatellia bacterium]|nr:prolyl oligopeptidase family serine peptidase [Blastocatellia bacterium]
MVKASKNAGESETGLLTRTVSVGGASYGYQVYVPAVAQEGNRLPVLLFLHGIGQRGTGGIVPSRGPASLMARHYLDRVPAIIVLPQCSNTRYWSNRDMGEMAAATLDHATTEFDGDDERISLIGVSMGGYGAWHLAAEHPGKFSAIVPICGGSPLREGDRFNTIARKVGRTPVWVFHGADDPIVPVSESRLMVDALRAAGGNVRYSEYPGVGHNVWLNVIAERDLLPWMLAQRRL